MTYYSFKVDTTRQRLVESIEAITLMLTPNPRSLEQLETVKNRLASHAKEIEAVSMTLRVQGVSEDKFLDYLPTMTPEHVMIEIHQQSLSAEVETKQFHE